MIGHLVSSSATAMGGGTHANGVRALLLARAVTVLLGVWAVSAFARCAAATLPDPATVLALYGSGLRTFGGMVLAPMLHAASARLGMWRRSACLPGKPFFATTWILRRDLDPGVGRPATGGSPQELVQVLDRNRGPRGEGTPVMDPAGPIEGANDFVDRGAALVEGGQLPGVFGLDDLLGRAHDPGCFVGVPVLNGGSRLLLTIATIPPQPEAVTPRAGGREEDEGHDGDEEAGHGS